MYMSIKMGCRFSRVLSLLLLLTFLTSIPLGVSLTVRAESDTIPLPEGFLDDPRYTEFFDDIRVKGDQLVKALEARDPEAEGNPPFWSEIQALAAAKEEHDLYAWALRENPQQHNFKIALKPITKIIEMYTGVSQDWGSASWMTQKAGKSLLKLMGYGNTVKFINVVNTTADVIELYKSLQKMKEFERNNFIWASVQEDVFIIPDWWLTVSDYAPKDISTVDAKEQAHHFYEVVNRNIESDWAEIQDRIYQVLELQRTGISSVQIYKDDGRTPLKPNAMVIGDSITVRVTLVDPSEFGSIRLDVRPFKEYYLTEPKMTHFSNTPPDGSTTSIPVKGLSPGEYCVQLRLVTNKGTVMDWTIPDLRKGRLSSDFIIKASGEDLAAPGLLSATPASDGASSGIILKWAPVKRATNYLIYRDGVLIYTTRSAGTTFWNTGLVPGRKYTYTIASGNGSAVSDYSNPLTATAPSKDKPNQSPRVVVDGGSVPLDTAPLNVNGRLLVPLRAIGEALGASVDWNPANQTATLALNGTVVKVTVGSATAFVNGKQVALDVQARITEGRVMVPLRFVGESFGAEVAWDPEANAVIVIGLGPAAEASQEEPVQTAAESDEKMLNHLSADNTVGICSIASSGDSVYYKFWDDGGVLFRMKLDGSVNEKIDVNKSGFHLPQDLNVVGDWIYFNTPSGGYDTDPGRIFKIRNDGTELQIISGMENVQEIYVEENTIFAIGYLDGKEGIYKMDLDGSSCKKLVDISKDCVAYDIVAYEGCIYYIYRDSKYTLHKMKTDGSDNRVLSDYNMNYYNISGGWIYFYYGWSHRGDKDYGVFKMETDGKDLQKINDTPEHLGIVSDDYVYFTGISGSTNRPNAIFKYKTDGTGLSEIFKMDKEFYGGINIGGAAGEWIFCSYYTDKEIGIFRVKKDGSGFEYVRHKDR